MNILPNLKAGNSITEQKSNREVYLDLAKFFAMIMMVAGHTFFELTNPEFYNLNHFPWGLWNFARGKTAPTFLFLSGAVHVFANFKNNSSGISHLVFMQRIKMALILLVIGYTLNSPINTFSEIFNIPAAKLNSFYQVNILHIFGIGLMILAFVYRFAKSEQRVLQFSLLISLFIIAISPLVVNSNLDFLPTILTNYINYQNGSIFTITPYIAYIFLGTVFGILLRRRLITQREIPNENVQPNKFSNLRIGLLILLSSLCLIIFGIIITKSLILLSFTIDLRSDIGVVIRNAGIILLIIFFARQIKITNSKLIWLVSTLSKRAIFIYVVHLFIIYGIGNISGLKHYFSKSFEPPTSFLFSALVIFSSILITLILDKLIKSQLFIRLSLGLLAIYSIYFILH